VEVKPNEPKLADVRAPWEGVEPKWRLFTPPSLWKTVIYNSKYRWFWAPSSMDGWRYRVFLKDLDEVCLRSLDVHGALTAEELTEWLNRDRLLRTKPERTGIQSVALPTVDDWCDFGSRRGLITAWSSPAGRPASPHAHWQLTEKGQEAVRSKLLVFLDRFYPLLVALTAGGLLLGFFKWLAVHPGVVAWTLILGIEVSGLAFFAARSERKATSGEAVVAIETLRSAGRRIPSLGS